MKYEKIEDNLISKINVDVKTSFKDLKPYINTSTEKEWKASPFKRGFKWYYAVALSCVCIFAFVTGIVIMTRTTRCADAAPMKESDANIYYNVADVVTMTSNVAATDGATESVIANTITINDIENGEYSFDLAPTLVTTTACCTAVKVYDGANMVEYPVEDEIAEEIRGDYDGAIYILNIDGVIFYCKYEDGKYIVLNK